jgi:hypothetical protein
MSNDPTTTAKLKEALEAIRRHGDPRRATADWTRAYKLLQQTEALTDRVTDVVGMRDVDRLAALIAELGAPPPADAPGDETCAEALQAFRTRLSLVILDEESKLGHSPLTKGSDAKSIAAITPPREWPEPVWQELARRGDLRYVGHGLYELTGESNG